jgi:RNA polymerase sigma-70 factor (ECF subfamily)
VRQHGAASLDASAVRARQLYERYSGRIFAYCLHALRDREEAEDAAQTTFLNAQRALQRGVIPEHEFAWLHTIAKNVCRMQKRTAARRGALTGVDLDALPARDDGARDDQELLAGLGDALASLPERQRRALVMREWYGLSSEEVATRLGTSTPATYALVSRARRSLAHALTSLPRRATLGLNFAPLLLRLKTLVGGGAAKVAGTTAAAAAVAAGGAVLGPAVVGPQDRPSRAGERTVDAASTAFPRPASPAAGGGADRRATGFRSTAPAGAGDRAAGGAASPARDETDAADGPPTPAEREAEGARAEPPATSSADSADSSGGAVEDVVEPILDDPPGSLPLPEVDLDLPPVVPEEPLPDVEDLPLPDLPGEPPPLPLPLPLPLPVPQDLPKLP